MTVVEDLVKHSTINYEIQDLFPCGIIIFCFLLKVQFTFAVVFSFVFHSFDLLHGSGTNMLLLFLTKKMILVQNK